MEREEQRQRILDVAQDHFAHYGYHKTTMADIARGCGCSASNLYRFFDNKQEIAAAVCRRCLDERMAVVREAASRPGASAAERLRGYALALLEVSRSDAESGSRIGELVAWVLEQRTDLVHARVEIQTGLIAEILEYGNRRGEFAVADPAASARAVYAALTLFDVPIFQSLYDEARFREIAESTVALLLAGLNRR